MKNKEIAHKESLKGNLVCSVQMIAKHGSRLNHADEAICGKLFGDLTSSIFVLSVFGSKASHR